MTSINSISAEELINKNPVTVSKEQSLSQIKNVMEKEDTRTVSVLDNDGDFEGAIGYRDLIRYIQFNPEKTKVSKVMHQPPKFKKGDSLVDLADLRINSGKKMLVSLSGDKLEGIVSDREFAKAFSDVDEFENLSTKDIESDNLLTVFEQDSLEEARHKMLDNNISRLPVLDKNGNLTGMLRSTDLLKTMVPRESIDSGGTSGNRKGTNEVNIAGGIEKNKMSSIPVEELMERNFLTSKDHMNGCEASKKMVEEERDEILFVNGNYPESIVAVKDLIDYAADFAPGKTVLVSLTGIDVPEEKAAVHNAIKKQLRGSIGRKIERPQELRMRFKKKDADGKQHRYEIDTRLDCEHGLIKIDEEGWGLMNTVDKALDQLNTVLRKKKQKRNEHRA